MLMSEFAKLYDTDPEEAFRRAEFCRLLQTDPDETLRRAKMTLADIVRYEDV